jgi:hypothetical protein
MSDNKVDQEKENPLSDLGIKEWGAITLTVALAIACCFGVFGDGPNSASVKDDRSAPRSAYEACASKVEDKLPIEPLIDWNEQAIWCEDGEAVCTLVGKVEAKRSLGSTYHFACTVEEKASTWVVTEGP